MSTCHLQVVFDHVEMRYRPGLPLVLKGLSVRIPAASKCGVVGRTGRHTAQTVGNTPASADALFGTPAWRTCVSFDTQGGAQRHVRRLFHLSEALSVTASGSMALGRVRCGSCTPRIRNESSIRLCCLHTGAGKSSLINCIFRLMDLDSGKITIDGIDISRLGVKQLRSRMAIIPQVRA